MYNLLWIDVWQVYFFQCIFFFRTHYLLNLCLRQQFMVPTFPQTAPVPHIHTHITHIYVLFFVTNVSYVFCFPIAILFPSMTLNLISEVFASSCVFSRI